MRTHQPRLTPLPDDALDAAQDAILAPFRKSGRDYNIFRTFLRYPKALKVFLGWGSHILSDQNSLPPRLRELAILRTGYRCRAGYEFARHVVIARREGFDDADISAIKGDADDRHWSPLEQAIMAATDALVTDQFIPDALWTTLSGLFDERQLLDLIFTVGQYTMVSMFLNSVGVPLDDDVTLDPDLDARDA